MSQCWCQCEHLWSLNTVHVCECVCARQRQREKNTLSWCCHPPSQLASSANKQYPRVPVAITHVCPFISAQREREGTIREGGRGGSSLCPETYCRERNGSNMSWHFIRDNFHLSNINTTAPVYTCLCPTFIISTLDCGAVSQCVSSN